jgi:hypothetical protein
MARVTKNGRRKEINFYFFKIFYKIINISDQKISGILDRRKSLKI